MANPALNDKTFAPERVRTIDPTALTTRPAAEAWRDRMTLDGVVVRSFSLLAILAVTGYLGWRSVERVDGTVEVPGWLILGVLAGLGVAVLTIFRPKLSPFTSPAYAAIEGLVLGAISAVYDSAYDGIVLQAVLLTGAVFALMLTLFTKRIVTVTDKFRRGVLLATGAVMVVYGLTLILNLFGSNVPYIHDSGPVGILFSLVVVGLASANLLVDFDVIERGITAGAPKWMEWYAAFGLLVTLVWLYLELLRLLAKLRER